LTVEILVLEHIFDSDL